MKVSNLKPTHTLCFLMFFLVGCEKSLEEKLIGTWKCELNRSEKGASIDAEDYNTFNEDSTFQATGHLSISAPNRSVSFDYKHDGTWSLNDKTLILITSNMSISNTKPANSPLAKAMEAETSSTIGQEDLVAVNFISDNELTMTQKGLMTQCHRQ